jgi:hypothetical protein
MKRPETSIFINDFFLVIRIENFLLLLETEFEFFILVVLSWKTEWKPVLRS